MSEILRTCVRCGWRYPEELLSPVIGSSFGRQPVCGLCALQIVNAVHGTKRTTFSGQAEEMRLDALEWRKGNTSMKPPADVERTD